MFLAVQILNELPVPGDPMLFVLNSLGVGGSEIKIVKLANALAELGDSVDIAYLSQPETILPQIAPAVRVTNLHRRGKYSYGALRRLRDLVAHEEVAVVAVNLYPLLYVIPATNYFDSLPVRTVGLINTSQLTGRQKVFGRMYAHFLRRCDHLIFGCESQREHWLDEYSLPPKRSSVIYNGIDFEFYSADTVIEQAKLLRDKLAIPNGAFVVGGVGRLAPEKDYRILLPAAANLNASARVTYVVIVGDGPERESLTGIAEASGISDKVKFTGSLGDIRPAVAMFDAFVQCSRNETFSNAALEAMSMGLAVVLSDTGGVAEMIEDGKSGLLFPVGDTSRLTQHLTELYDGPELRRELGTSARDRVVEKFGFAKMVGEYRRLMQKE